MTIVVILVVVVVSVVVAVPVVVDVEVVLVVVVVVRLPSSEHAQMASEVPSEPQSWPHGSFVKCVVPRLNVSQVLSKSSQLPVHTEPNDAQYPSQVPPYLLFIWATLTVQSLQMRPFSTVPGHRASLHRVAAALPHLKVMLCSTMTPARSSILIVSPALNKNVTFSRLRLPGRFFVTGMLLRYTETVPWLLLPTFSTSRVTVPSYDSCETFSSMDPVESSSG